MSEPWPTSRHVNIKTGKVRCFDISASKYVDKYPVDIREGVEIGTLSQYAPDESVEERKDEGGSEVTAEQIDKANTKTLENIVSEKGLDVDLNAYEKLADKRKAVKDALQA